MKTTAKLLTLLLVSVFAITGCKKEDDTDNDGHDHNHGAYETGVFISNEGPFGSGSGTISFYNRTSGAVSNSIYQSVNSVPLGNIVQSVSVHNGKGYVVVNNAGKVDVVGSSDFKLSGSITGLDKPRYFLGISSTKGYVSQWGSTGTDGSIKVIDLSNNSVSKTITAGSGADKMAHANGKLYVVNQGGFGFDSVVTIINSATDVLDTNIYVGPNPNSVHVDVNGNVWVLCGGKWNSGFTALEQQGRLVKINGTTNAIDLTLNFSSTSSTPNLMVINKAANTLYYNYSNGIYAHDISATSLSTTPVLNKGFYGLGLDPESGYLFGADAGDFVSDGWVHRYNVSGAKIDSFQVGIIPGGFFFN